MSDTALVKLEQLIEQLINKNSAQDEEFARMKAQNEELAAQVVQLKEDNEAVQLEALEQEEKHAETLRRINAIVGRLEQDA